MLRRSVELAAISGSARHVVGVVSDAETVDNLIPLVIMTIRQVMQPPQEDQPGQTT
jgi:hypothetical protein